MCLNLTLSQCGLISDMLGVALLFLCGLPSKIENPDAGNLMIKNLNEESKIPIIRKNKWIHIGANTGLLLAFIGFLLQFIGGFK
jgi:hypothetical protein